MKELERKIKEKQNLFEKTKKEIVQKKAELQAKKDEAENLKDELHGLKRDYFVQKYNLTFNKDIFVYRGEEYLLVDLNQHLFPVFLQKKKNGEWGAKQIVIGAYDFEKKDFVENLYDLKL